MIDQAAAQKSFGIFQDALQRVFYETGLIGERYNSYREALPEILMLDFCDCDIKFLPQTIFQAAEYLTLILERMCFRKIDFER
jgi:hypothetical protein